MASKLQEKVYDRAWQSLESFRFLFLLIKNRNEYKKKMLKDNKFKEKLTRKIFWNQDKKYRDELYKLYPLAHASFTSISSAFIFIYNVRGLVLPKRLSAWKVSWKFLCHAYDDVSAA